MEIDADEWTALSPVLDRMLEYPPARRAEWVQGLSGAEAHWKPRLLALLQSVENPKLDWLNTLPAFTQLSGMYLGPPGETAWHDEPTDIGPYRLVRLLGRGGMGRVYFAERADGLVRRGVALKLPHSMIGDEVLAARFAREREIVASLSHPNIAHLYDAGIAADGQPYLALEYVEGKPLDLYCDTHGLGIAARLALFRQVLDAVQYAHSRLVIHRDLKPSNILVTEAGHVQLLDFGIAKLLDTEAAERTELTRMGSPLMTLNYASPEQVAGEAAATTTDIYSLGIVLFELLVGVRPYRLPRDTRGALEEAILSADIPLPSAAVGAAAADKRGTTLKKLHQALRGDLDAILLKMLRKQPTERYATAAAVNDDLMRFEEGNAVRAHRPSRWYWWRKFIARNRLLVGSGAVVCAALLIGTAVALWQARVAGQQARLAAVDRDRALAAAAHREAVDEFMSDLLLEAGRTGTPISVADLIERANALSALEFANDPDARAAVLATVGRFAMDLDGVDKALPYFDQAAALVAGSRDAQLRAEILCTRANLRGYLGHTDEAQRVFKQIIDDPESSAEARSQCWGDAGRLAVARYDESAALRATDRALTEWQASVRRSPTKRLELLTYQAEAMALGGRQSEAEGGYAYVLRELKRLGRERSELSEEVLSNRLSASMRSGDFKLALEQVNEAISIMTRDFSDRLPPAVWEYGRSKVLVYLGRYAEAVAGFERVAHSAAARDQLTQQRAELDAAAALSKMGRREEAERLYRSAVDQAGLRVPGNVPHADTAILLTRAKLDFDAQNFRDARENLGRVLRAKTVIAASRNTAYSLRALTELSGGDMDLALSDARESLGISEKQRGDNQYSAWVGQAQLVLGQVLEARGDGRGAQSAYAAALLQLAHTVDSDHPACRQAQQLLAALDKNIGSRE